MARFNEKLATHVARRAHLPADFVAEITQEVLRRVEGTRFAENLRYQMAVARNYAADAGRQRRRIVLECDLADPTLLDGESVCDAAERTIIARLTCETLLSHLSPTDRRIIRLRFWEGWNSNEIGRELSISETAVNVRIFRAFAHLRDLSVSSKKCRVKLVKGVGCETQRDPH